LCFDQKISFLEKSAFFYRKILFLLQNRLKFHRAMAHTVSRSILIFTGTFPSFDLDFITAKRRDYAVRPGQYALYKLLAGVATCLSGA